VRRVNWIFAANVSQLALGLGQIFGLIIGQNIQKIMIKRINTSNKKKG